MIADFNKDVKKGEKGEYRLKLFLKKYAENNSMRFLDVSHDKEYQQMDIDFIITDDNEKYAIELKTDSYDSGNMFFEELSSIETHSIGCFLRTKANILLYYFEKTEDVYVFYNIQKFREWYEKNKNSFRHCKITNRGYGSSYYNAYGGLIPLVQLNKAMKDENFGTKLNFLSNTPTELIEGIKLTVPFSADENIIVSNKTQVKPIFKSCRP